MLPSHLMHRPSESVPGAIRQVPEQDMNIQYTVYEAIFLGANETVILSTAFLVEKVLY